MALKRKLPPEFDPEGFMMTPMIDIVFQLLIFFMLITDMSKVQVEALALPEASKAIDMKEVDDQILILNVQKDGTIRISGKTYYKPEMGDNNKTLEDLFEKRRQMKQFQEEPGKDQWTNYAVLIRCDRSTPFENVQKILMIASSRGGVTRIQLGAKLPAGH